jgi:hypothetical protein
MGVPTKPIGKAVGIVNKQGGPSPLSHQNDLTSKVKTWGSNQPVLMWFLGPQVLGPRQKQLMNWQNFKIPSH